MTGISPKARDVVEADEVVGEVGEFFFNRFAIGHFFLGPIAIEGIEIIHFLKGGDVAVGDALQIEEQFPRRFEALVSGRLRWPVGL